MKNENKKIIYELIKLVFVIIVIGAVFGALYEIKWKIELKIIFGGFFIMLGLIANEVSRVFNINDHLSEIHSKTLLQLILMGKKQGVKEDLADTWDKIENDTKKKLDFESMLIGNTDSKIYFGFIIAIVAIAFVTVYAIRAFAI